MYWFPLFYKIFTGFVVKVCQLDVLSKKLPSHDRLTTDKGVEPLTANKKANHYKPIEIALYSVRLTLSFSRPKSPLVRYSK